MDMIFFILFFPLSLFIGSFFGVLIDRIYRSEQFVRGRSYCEHCKHTLQTLDLIPLFSYIFLNGKCRYCKKEIPAWLPLIELITAVTLSSTLFLLINNDFLSPLAKDFFTLPYPSSLAGSPFAFIAQILIALAIASVFILIFITDAKYMVIPDIYLYLLVALYPLYLTFFKLQITQNQNIALIKDNLIAAVILAIFFAALHYGSRKKAMGEGDIYLAAIIGFYLGTNLSVVMWFMAFLKGAIEGVILLISGKKKMKSALSFGPFLILGFCFALIWGTELLNWYLSI